MAETLTIRTASSTEIVKIAVPGPQGPKGDKGDPGDVAGLPLTTQGDTLYRGASENQRLPIGTAGQILKVSSGGIPEWGAAPATGVTSVTGTAPIASSGGNTPAISISEATTSAAGSMSAADKTKLDGIAAGAEVNVNADWNASSGDAQILNKPTIPTASSATPSALGVAAAGSSNDFARADHVHAMPSAADVGAVVAGSGGLGGEGTQIAYINDDGELEQGSSATAQTLGELRDSLGLGDAAVADIGTGAGDVCAGDDARLSDARTPTAHAASHAASGSDPLDVADLSSGTATNTLAPLADGSGGISWEQLSAATNVAVSPADIQIGDQGWANIPADDNLQNVLGQINSNFAPASHTHGNLTSDGKVGSTAGLPLVTTTAGAVTTLALGTANQVLRVNSGATGVEFADPAGSGGSKTYAVFTATDNQPPATAFATYDTRSSIAVLDFDDATDESAVFVGIIPEGASLGSGLKIRLHWMATTATSGNCVWDVSLERMTTDLDSDSFDTIASATAAANGTSGILTVTEITLTTIDSVTAGDGFRLKVTRDANSGSDSLVGDSELVLVEVRSAA